jgi:hypothetical protein
LKAKNKKDEATPSGIVLFQNYPNPFNPSTIIRFTVGVNRDSPSNSDAPVQGTNSEVPVQLKMDDASVSEVKTLVNRNMKAGKHEVQFNASGMASGTCFYKLTGQPADGSQTIVINKSMQILKK